MLVIPNLSMRCGIEHKVHTHAQNRWNKIDTYTSAGNLPTIVVVVIAKDDSQFPIQFEGGKRIGRT